MGDTTPGHGLASFTKHSNPADAWDDPFDAEFEVKEVSADGTFTGYGSVFGNMDSDRDVIAPGAFAGSLKKKGASKVKLLWQHDPRQPIGVWEEMSEDKRGLKVTGRLLINQGVPKADEAYALLKAGALDAMSVGFSTTQQDWEIDDKKRVRVIKNLDLWEISLVTFPANARARITRVKSGVPFQDLGMTDRGRPWDSAKADERVRQWAGGSTNIADMDWVKYSQEFLWYDGDNAEDVASYKLQVADVISGDLQVIPRGVFAAAGALLGARGGVDIPDEAKQRAMSHLDRYYSKLDMESPFKAIDMADSVKNYNMALLAACDGPVSFKKTLADVGFSKKQAEDIAAVISPRTENEETEAVTRLLQVLKSVNNPTEE